MTVAVAVLGVLLAVALLFLVALLRSHAEILRRLAAIESAWDAGIAVGAGGARRTDPRKLDSARAVGPATDISGQTLSGDALKVSLGPGAPDTLLAFMGTGCHACAPLWDALHDSAVPTPGGARLVVVTKGPERERLARLLEIAPAGVEVVMSTQAWSDFEIASTPHFVLVRDGGIAGRGSATSWEQITGFLSDADADDRVHEARAGIGTDPRAAAGIDPRAAIGTEARAARAERALADSGIGPEHPSLYPSRLAGGPVSDPTASAHHGPEDGGHTEGSAID
jgi:hypothetical protein